MKILHTEWMEAKGGQASRVLDDLKIIKELGHTPFLACKSQSWLYQNASEAGIAVFDVQYKNIFDIKSFFQLLKIMKKHQIDIVHTHSSKDSYVATLAAKISGLKIVRSRHMQLTKKPTMLYYIADAIVTTGEKIREAFIGAGVEKEKIVSIPSYPDEDLYRPSEEIRTALRKKYHIEKEIVIASMTGFNSQKRPRLLLPVIAKLVSEGYAVKLLLAGKEEEDEKKRFDEKVKALKIEEYVGYVGFVQAEVFLNVIDIYVCPSSSEGIPQALMQAMMMGKAAVSTNVGSICDLNREDTLRLVEKDDTKALGQWIETLVKEETLRRELGQKNYDVMRKYFSRSVMKEKTKMVYENLK